MQGRTAALPSPSTSYGTTATIVTGAVCSAVDEVEVGMSILSDTTDVPDAAIPVSKV